MKVVVTGSRGFIGSHVVDLLLARGHSVIVIDNHSTGRAANLAHVASEIRLIEEDLARPGGWVAAFAGADWIAHLAGLADIVPSIQNPTGYFQANNDGTFNVLQAARAVGVTSFDYAASSSYYGIPDHYPTPEPAPMRPQYPYALTKRLGEELVMHWAQVYGLPALSLRFFNVYGLRSRTSGTYGAVFGVFLAQKLAGKPFIIVRDGTQTRDFTDVARAVLAALESDATGDIFNVGSGATVSVNRLVDLLGGERVFIPKRPGAPDTTFADIGRITARLGWRPQVPIEQGVAEILKHIDYWCAAPVWDPASIADATRDWFTYLGRRP